MAIPSEITRENVLQALADLDSGRKHPFGPSREYDLVHNGKRYPPKGVVGLAAQHATGKPLSPSEFGGGEGAGQANQVLRDLGFAVAPKGADRAPAPLPEALLGNAWIEFTRSTHQHGGPGWEFGRCLWSPSAARDGRDFYAAMRQVQEGDLVIHCLDLEFQGFSYAAGPHEEVDHQPPSPGQWADMAPYYRVPLKDYTPFPERIPRPEFIAEFADEIRDEIESAHPRRYPFVLLRSGIVQTVQGGYITVCTRRLYDIFRKRLSADYQAAKPQPGTQTITHSGESGPQSYWVISPGEGARLWKQFVHDAEIRIGWGFLGDLSVFQTSDDVLDELVKRGDGEARPTNNARAIHEFVHVLKPGDYVFAKKGRRKVIGLGVVESGYTYDDTRSEYGSIRKVRWLKTGEWSLPEGVMFVTKTLTDLTRYSDFVAMLLALVEGPKKPEVPQPPATGPEPYSIDDAIADVFISREELTAILRSLGRKRNLILQGPPGVGKTFIAKRLAYAQIGAKDPDKVGFVQFHQSYAYEDFIRGWRPGPSGGFILQDGVFFEFSQKARQDPDNTYVFIIDEINRANLSKVFGELLMLLEADKREPEFAVPLTYRREGDVPFHIPDNLLLIGLMNTADRSLAMVDYALRRRFGFVDLKPAFETAEFSDYLTDAGATPELIDRIVSRMTTLNARIRSDTSNLGPGYEIGHSFFCPLDTEDTLDETWYETVIRDEVAPLLREYWFESSDTAEQLIADLLL